MVIVVVLVFVVMVVMAKVVVILIVLVVVAVSGVVFSQPWICSDIKETGLLVIAGIVHQRFF